MFPRNKELVFRIIPFLNTQPPSPVTNDGRRRRRTESSSVYRYRLQTDINYHYQAFSISESATHNHHLHLHHHPWKKLLVVKSAQCKSPRRQRGSRLIYVHDTDFEVASLASLDAVAWFAYWQAATICKSFPLVSQSDWIESFPCKRGWADFGFRQLVRLLTQHMFFLLCDFIGGSGPLISCGKMGIRTLKIHLSGCLLNLSPAFNDGSKIGLIIRLWRVIKRPETRPDLSEMTGAKVEAAETISLNDLKKEMFN